MQTLRANTMILFGPELHLMNGEIRANTPVRKRQKAKSTTIHLEIMEKESVARVSSVVVA
jgi:hypothetical protein